MFKRAVVHRIRFELSLGQADLDIAVSRARLKSEQETILRTSLETDSLSIQHLRASRDAVSRELSELNSLFGKLDATVPTHHADLEATFCAIGDLRGSQADDTLRLSCAARHVAVIDEDIARVGHEYQSMEAELSRKQRHVSNLSRELQGLLHGLDEQDRMMQSLDKEIKRRSYELAIGRNVIREKIDEVTMTRSCSVIAQWRLHKAAVGLDSVVRQAEELSAKLLRVENQVSQESDRQALILAGKENKEEETNGARALIGDTFSVLRDLGSRMRSGKSNILTESEVIESVKLKLQSIQQEVSVLVSSRSRLTILNQTLTAHIDNARERCVRVHFDLSQSQAQFLSLVGGDRNETATAALLSRIEELEKRLAELRETSTVIKKQLRFQETEMKVVGRSKLGVQTLMNSVRSQTETLEMEVGIVEQELLTLENERMRLLVARDELMAQMSSRRDELASVIDNFFRLQQVEADRSASLIQKMQTDTDQASQLRTHNKRLSEESHVLAKQVGEYHMVISRLRVELDDIRSRRLGKGPDDVHSHAHNAALVAENRLRLLETAEQLAEELQISSEELRFADIAFRRIRAVSRDARPNRCIEQGSRMVDPSFKTKRLTESPSPGSTGETYLTDTAVGDRSFNDLQVAFVKRCLQCMASNLSEYY